MKCLSLRKNVFEVSNHAILNGLDERFGLLGHAIGEILNHRDNFRQEHLMFLLVFVAFISE